MIHPKGDGALEFVLRNLKDTSAGDPGEGREEVESFGFNQNFQIFGVYRRGGGVWLYCSFYLWDKRNLEPQ